MTPTVESVPNRVESSMATATEQLQHALAELEKLLLQ